MNQHSSFSPRRVLTKGLPVALALAALLPAAAQAQGQAASFYAGGKEYPLLEAVGWVAVRVAPGADVGDVQRGLNSAVTTDQGRSGVYHSKYRILVHPVQDGGVASRAASMQQAAASVAGVERTVRMFFNGRLDPIIETEEFIIQFAPELPRSHIDELLAQNGAHIARPLGSYAPNGYVVRMQKPESSSSIETANKLHGLSGVVYSHPNLIWPKEQKFMPNDPLYPQQWHLNNTGSNGPAGNGGRVGGDIKAERAWEITRGSSNVVVAIVDDGVNTGHEDFKSTNKIQAGWDFVDNDNTPVPDPALDSDPNPRKHNDHGTSCAGLAVGDGNNSLGGSGVAPGCRLMSVRLLGANQTAESEAAAISSARDNGAAVISNSWGPADRGGPNNTSIAQPIPDNVSAAINDVTGSNGRGGKGCIVLWAAGNGNESVDLDGYASHPRVICVAATNYQDVKASYSDFGNAIDVCAPGSEADMVTTDRMGSKGYNPGNYTFNFNGTSAATPVAAGVVALILSKEPNLTRSAVTQRLIDTAEFVDTANATYDENGHHPWYGFGRVDAWRALAKNDNTDPTVTIRVPENNLSTTSLAAADGTANDTGLGIYNVQVALKDSINRWYVWSTNSWSSGGAPFDGNFHLKPAPVTNGTWSTALPNNLGSGGYDLYVKAVDKADNDSEFAQSHFIVDPTGPTIVISEPQNEHNYATAPQASGVAFDNITKKSFALFREDDGLWFNWNANSFDNATFNGSAHVKVLNETGSAWTLNLPSVSPGVYELHALATDTSGRSSDWVRRDFRVDRPPVVRVTSPAHGSGIQDLGTITGEVEDPSGEGFKENEVRFTLYCDGQYWTGSAWTSTQEELYATVHGGSWSYVNVPTGANERAGEYFISANVEDRTGAKSVPTPGVNQTSFRIDRDPPQVAISSPAHGSTITAKNFQFRGTASDVGGIQAVNVFLRRGSDYSYWNGSGWGSAPVVLRTDYNANTGEWVNVSGLPVLGGNSTSQMANGTYNFIAIAIDAAGNFQQTDSVVTVDYHKVLTWTGGFSSNWDDAANWTSPDGGSVPDASAVAIINNGAHIQSGQSRTLYELRLSSGFLDFTGANRTLTTTKKTTWTGGAFRGIWDNAPGAILEMSGTAVKHISDGAVFNNRGLVTWDGPGTIQAEGNGFVDNPVINNKSGGIFEIKGGGGLFSRASGRSGVPVFNNEAGARFLKSGGVGPLVIDTFHFNNVGEMRCDSGAIAFNTAAQFINAASLRGAGRFELQGGSLTLTGNLVLEETTFRVDLGDFVGAANGSAAIITVGNALFEGRGGRFFNKLTLTEGSRMHLTDPESGPNPKFFGDGLTLNNYGLIIWTGGGKILAQGDGFTDNPVFNNKSTGRFEAAADGVIFGRASLRSGVPVFNNEAGGRFTKTSGTGTLTLDTFHFNNAGLVTCASGLMDWNTVLNWNNAQALAGPGAFQLVGGQLNITGPFTVGANATFTTLAGTIVSQVNTGVPLVSPASRLRLQGGTFAGRFTVPAGSFVQLSDAPGGAVLRRFADGVILDNFGTITWLGGAPIEIEGNGFVDNPIFNNKSGGRFEAAADGALFSRASVRSGTPLFNNESGGTLAKTGGTGKLTFSVFNLVNAGQLKAGSGTLAFLTSFTWNDAPALEGPGAFEMTNGRIDMNGTFAVGNDTTFSTLAGIINGPYPNGVNLVAGPGRLRFHGGGLFGRYTIPASSNIELSDPASGPLVRRIMDGTVIDNYGKIVWLGGYVVEAEGQGFVENCILNNRPGGQFEVAADGLLFGRSSGRSGTPTFVNFAGATFAKTAGNGLTDLTTFKFFNFGQMAAQTGGFVFNTEIVFGNAAPLVGPGSFTMLTGRMDITGALAAGSATMNLRGTDIVAGNGGASLVSAIPGALRMQSGRYFGTFNVPAGSHLEFSEGPAGPQPKFFGDGSVLNNEGHIAWLGGGAIQADGYGHPNLVINNNGSGLFQIAANGSVFTRAQFRDGFPQLNNAVGAIVRKTVAGDSLFDTFRLDNSGQVVNDAGTLTFNTIAFARHGSSHAGAGTQRFIAGQLWTEGTVTFAAPFSITGGETVGPGSGFASLATTGKGLLNWGGGRFSGRFALTSGSRMLIDDGGSPTATEKDLSDGSVFDNYGVITWTGAGAIQAGGYGFQPNPVFNNKPTGVFNAMPSGGILNRESYRDGTPLFNNEGSVNVGAAPTVLRLEGWNFAQTSTGRIDVKLGGTGTSPRAFDQVQVTGFASLAGSIGVHLMGDYMPVPGSTFAVMTYGGRSGSFTPVQSLGDFATYQYNANNLTLVAKDYPKQNDAWEQYYFGSTSSPNGDPLADPDGDGIPNLLERALGQNPNNGGTSSLGVGGIAALDGKSASLEVQENGVRYLAFAYTRPSGAAALTDITYSGERANSLPTAAWSPADVVQYSVTPGPGESRETVIMRSTQPINGAAREFLRLSVSLNQ